MTTHTLKPCPYCEHLHLARCEQKNDLFSTGDAYWVNCPKCEMHGPESPTEDGSVAAWNALPRPWDVAALRARIAELGAAVALVEWREGVPSVEDTVPDGFTLPDPKDSRFKPMCGHKGPHYCRKGSNCAQHNTCVYFTLPASDAEGVSDVD